MYWYCFSIDVNVDVDVDVGIDDDGVSMIDSMKEEEKKDAKDVKKLSFDENFSHTTKNIVTM